MSDLPFRPDWFSKPGDTLAALMAQREMSVRQLAENFVTTLGTVRGVLDGAVDIDLEMAGKLSTNVGGSPAFWAKRQSKYEEALSRAAEAVPNDVGAAWLRKFPQKELSDYGWVKKQPRRADAIKSYLAYFGVRGPEEWEERYSDILTDIAFRTSAKFESRIGPLSAWLRQGEREAALVPTSTWNSEYLRSQLSELRKLSKFKSPGRFIPELRRLCAAAGIAVVFVRTPSGCRASGATRFVAPGKAMIALSFRYLSDDHFWFTLFHEIGHLILHGMDATFIDSEDTSENDREKEANSFAASVLIPLDRYEEMLSLNARANSIIRFAVSVGVAPGNRRWTATTRWHDWS